MKITLDPFDTMIASELARRRGQTVNALLSDLLRFEGCFELCKREDQPADQSNLNKRIHPKTKGQRLKMVSVALEFVVEMMREGYSRNTGVSVISGVPSDAIYVGTLVDDSSSSAYLIFSHPSFPQIADSGRIPEMDVVLKTTGTD